MIIELSIENGERFLFFTVYHRPQGYVFGEFFIALSHFIPLYSYIVIAGDLNSNLFDSTNYHGTHLKALIDEFSLHVIPSGASHHVNFSDTWLDLILVNDEDKVLNFKKSAAPFICGHDYIIIDLELRHNSPTEETRRYRDFRNFEPSVFIRKIQSNHRSDELPNV